MKYKKIRSVLFLVLMLIIVVGSTGCNINDTKGKTENILDTEEEEKTLTVTPSSTPEVSVDPTNVETIESVITNSLGVHVVEGVVVAVNAQSFLLSDSTGMILVYMGSTWIPDVEVGQKLRLTGTTSDYAKARQFSKDSTYEVIGNGSVKHPSYLPVGGYNADKLVASSNIMPTFVKVYGRLSISGKYYNLTIDGANNAIGSLSYPVNVDELSNLNGKLIQVYGYVTGVSGSDMYLNIIPTSVTELSIIDINDANEIAATKQHNTFTEESYKVSGTIVDIANEKYGNMTITDGNNSIFVYGVYNADGLLFGELNKKPAIGDRVELVGSLGTYNGKNQMKNAVLFSFKSDNEPIDSFKFVNFFMINDTHGAFLDSSDSVSIGRVDTLIDSLTAGNGEYIKIHNGDAFQGSYISGQRYGLPIIESLNVMEFDCFVLGNHEFDWGIDKIAAYADGNLENGEANFPFLGANIYYKGTTTRPDWIDAYTIVEYGDINVGIIGVMGHTHESSILTSYVKDYEFVDPYNIIVDTTKELRGTYGCDVVVVATHDYDSSFNNQIANLTGESRIDAIFSAHTHQLINETVTRQDGVVIPVVQNYDKNGRGTSVVISLDDNNNMQSAKVAQYNPENYAISAEIQKLINSYQDLITEANESLGSTSNTISKSKLGSYAVEAMLNYNYNEDNFAGIDIAIMNTGGVRATIESGDITRAGVFEVFPFNNKVVLVNMSGKLLKTLCAKNNNYFYIGVSDEYGTYANFKDDEIYQLAVIDYVFEGTRYTQFSNLTSDDYLQTEIIMRDLLIEYIDDLY